MDIGVIGGGSVGQTLAAAFAAQGHAVRLGIRDTSAAELAKPRSMARPLGEWSSATGVPVTTIEQAAAFGALIVNATNGAGALPALARAGAALDGKVVVDVSNPLDFSRGMPPFLMPELSGPTSLGEQIQAAHPQAKVVKAFNTVTAAVMADPSLVPGEHDLLIAGNDAGAKAQVTDLARRFGWTSILDLGPIAAARATESYLPLWVRLMMGFGHARFNIRVVRG